MDATAAKRQFEDLPRCLMMDILLRLPKRSLLMCRCVCKSWLPLFSDPFFVKLQLVKSRSCILRSGDSLAARGIEVDVLSLVDEKIEAAVIDLPVRPTNCVNSCNGLLCLEIDGRRDTYEDEIWVGNPILREWITIQAPPDLDDSDGGRVYGFGFSPKSNQYKLLCFQHVGDNQYATTIYTLGTGRWRSLEGMSLFDGGRGYLWYLFCNTLGTFMNGSIHWITGRGTSLPIISYFDFESERFGTLPLPPRRYYDVSDAVELSVLNDCLSASIDEVDEKSEFVKIWGMKEYGVEKSWTMMHAIAYRDGCGYHFPFDELDIRMNEDDDLTVLPSFNEDEVLMRCGFEKIFVSFDTKTETFRILEWPQYGARMATLSISLTAYNPSFVSLHDVAMEECMVVQSCSAGGKKMLEKEANRNPLRTLTFLFLYPQVMLWTIQFITLHSLHHLIRRILLRRSSL